MSELVLFLFFCFVGLALIKTGVVDLVLDRATGVAVRAGAWITSKDGLWGSLVERLHYRDFYDDVVEMSGGGLWAGAEIEPVPTDGYGNKDWNQLRDPLNRAFTALDDETCVQIITVIDGDVSNAVKVYERLSDTKSSLKPLTSSRAQYLQTQANKGRVRNVKTYVFIGRRLRRTIAGIPISGFLSSRPFVERKHEEINTLKEEVLRARDVFINEIEKAGGKGSPIPGSKAFELAYKKLNPERAKHHTAPLYQFQSIGSENINRNKQVSDDADEIYYDNLRADLFAENPNETLCFTEFDIKGDYFLIGDVYSAVINLQRLPIKVFPGLMETLTRETAISSMEIATHFEIGDQHAWYNKLSRMQSWLQRNIKRSLNSGKDPNDEEVDKKEEYEDVRRQLRNGEEKIGELGLGITFTARSFDELQRTRDKILSSLRSMEGLEGVSDRHCPLDLFLSTLPCHPNTDFRRKICMSRDAVGLSTLTGSSTGIEPEEAIEVFITSDGRPFFWNPRYKNFLSGMSIFCGAPGSGKSATLNRQRTTLLLVGHRGITMDFGGSAYRICRAVGGKFINVADPTLAGGLGLFAIRPQPGEEFKADELSEEGLPLDRLQAVEAMLEMLCLDPTRPSETALPPVLASYLRKVIRQTYANLVDENPIVDDFIRELRRGLREDREKGEELAARLEIYSKASSLGRFLNDRSDPLPIDSHYIVYDCGGDKVDPRTQVIMGMAVLNQITRFFSTSRSIPKFVDVDELQVVARHPLLRLIIDRIIRTARKANAVCSVASQDPMDFDNPEMRGIAASTEVFWLFKMPTPAVAAGVFGITTGQVKEIGRLVNGGDEFREGLLVYPGTGQRRLCAKLRFYNSLLDRRLLLGAGHERATFDEAMADLTDVTNDNLIAALQADGLGADARHRADEEQYAIRK